MTGAAGVMTGAAGVAGIEGLRGGRGEQGPVGQDGRSGAKGEKGEPGIAGKPGRDGIDGKARVAGPVGPAGKDGKPGLDGKTGPAGPAGPKGPAGISDLKGSGTREISALLRLPKSVKMDQAVLRRIGDTVELSLAGLSSKAALNAGLGKIPSGFRPDHAQSLVTSDSDFRLVRVSVESKRSADLMVNQPPSADGLSPVTTSLVWLTNDAWPKELPGEEWKHR